MPEENKEEQDVIVFSSIETVEKEQKLILDTIKKIKESIKNNKARLYGRTGTVDFGIAGDIEMIVKCPELEKIGLTKQMMEFINDNKDIITDIWSFFIYTQKLMFLLDISIRMQKGEKNIKISLLDYK